MLCYACVYTNCIVQCVAVALPVIYLVPFQVHFPLGLQRWNVFEDQQLPFWETHWNKGTFNQQISVITTFSDFCTSICHKPYMV